MLEQVVTSSVADALSDFGGQVTEESIQALNSKMQGIYYPAGTAFTAKSQSGLTEEVLAAAQARYAEKEARYSSNVMRELERVFMLRVVDEYWMDNIDAMDDLKQGIGLRAYGQHDPVIAYKEEGFEMFQAMITAIREETIRRLMTVELRPSQEVKRQKVATEFSTSGDQTVKKQPVRVTGKVGPNDPCPCGSGKKHKKCCMHKEQ
jgi:preprotein translocase subunit SecA